MAPAPPLLLIGSTNSYFTLKVRGYLKWKGVAFEETVPSAELYRTYLAAVVKVQQMPVLVDRVRKEAVVDTSTIIDYVEKWYSPSEADAAAAPCLLGGAVPAAPRQRAMCYLLETFADEWLKFPAMHYRWSFPSQRAATAQDFGELLYPAAAQGERLKRCGSAMAKFGGFLAPLGIHAGTTAAGVERAFRTLCERLTAHLECFEFLFGAKPTLADFAFAGPFAAHLCRDPVPAALVRAEYPLVATWVERVQLITPPLSGRGWVVDGEGLPVRAPYPDAQARRMNAAFENDGIPASLERVLDVCFEEHAPILINTHAAVQQYLARTPTAAAGRRAIPRIIGFHPFRIGGVDGKRAVWPLDLWKLARGIPASHDAKAAVRTYVASRYGANGRALMDVMDALPPLHLIDGTKLYTALPKGGAHL
eukprot:TRINITY_DN2415_c0_g4_i1.p1 TRINITY_DN2415_c0_g4~~TRINITY_DN2415_c0_g4_i1.p1  ORF type:complete len:421 (+),score=131.91 TRINITY_DN2415_c0_g4_i1:164-1426(+)